MCKCIWSLSIVFLSRGEDQSKVFFGGGSYNQQSVLLGYLFHTFIFPDLAFVFCCKSLHPQDLAQYLPLRS